MNTNVGLNIVRIELLPDDNPRIPFAGILGRKHWVQAATHLVHPIRWETLSTERAGTNGLWTFTDLHATNYPLRFHRSAQPSQP